MKDYSNYHPSFNNKVLNDGRVLFELQKNSIEGYDVTIDGVATKLIIVDKYNNPDGDLKRISGDIDSFNIGSVIVHQNENWIVIQKTVNNPIYQSGIIQLTNNTLNFYDTSSTLHSIPCIITNKINLSTNENEYMILPDKIVQVICSNTNETSLIKEGQRFILGNYAYRTDSIDDISQVGLLNVRMSFSEKNNNDDFVNKIASQTTSQSPGGVW